MMKLKPLRWLTIIIPLLLALGVFLLIVSGRMPDGTFDLRMDDSTLVLLGGALLSLLLTVNFLSQRWLDGVHQRSMERAKQETAEEHRQFLNRLDHELKNPLMALRAGLSNLSETHNLDDQRKIIGSLSSQTVRIGALVSDLRKVATIGTYPLEMLPISLTELLNEVYATINDDPRSAGRVIRLTLPTHDSSLIGDRDLLSLALHNLLINALKYSLPKDTVELRGYRDGGDVVLEVADSGFGIARQEQQEVWKELYRGQGAQGIAGSGIGLALVHAISERHSGTVTLQSEVDKGTTVSIRLPAASANHLALKHRSA